MDLPGKTKFVSHSENIPVSNHNIFELKDGKAIESEDKKYYEASFPITKLIKLSILKLRISKITPSFVNMIELRWAFKSLKAMHNHMVI